MTRSVQTERTGNVAGGRPAKAVAGDRRVWILVVAVLVTHILVSWLARDTAITTRQDDATYVLLAESLRSLGYHDAFRPDSPLHNMYPPGYPALIALWGLPFGDAFDWLVALNVAFSAATLLLVFLTLRRFVAPWLAGIAVVPLAVSPGLVNFAGSVATEVPYAFFATLALYLLSSSQLATKRWGWAVAAAVMAAMTRSIGVTLLAALFLHFALERQWKQLAVLSVSSALIVGGWLLWTIVSPEHFVGRSYVADALAGVRETGDGMRPNLLRRVIRRIPVYFGENVPWAMGVPTVRGTPIDNVVSSLGLVGGLAAGLLLFWRHWRVAAIYLAAYFGLLFIWTFATDRFVVPLLPLLVPAVILGLAWAAGFRSRRVGFAVALATMLVLAGGGAARTLPAVRDGLECERGGTLPSGPCLRRDEASYFAALAWIRENTPEDAIILSAKPEPLYFYTGRKSPPVRRATSVEPENFLTHLRETGTDYILLGSLQATEVGRLPQRMKLHCEALAVEAFFPARTWLFRLRSSDEPTARDACDAIDRSIELNRNRRFGVDP